MEIKGNISIAKTSKGKYTAKFSWVNKKGKRKEQPIVKIVIPEKYNGKECIVEMEGNKIIKVIIEGQEFAMKQIPKNNPKNAKSIKQNHNRHKYSQRRSNLRVESKGTECTAHAPFNFVPLNKKIVPSQKLPFQDGKLGFIEGRNSGYIKCELETITPLFIGQGKDNPDEATKFFNIKSKVEIPGSSIRGMVRTLVQIVSWSKFKFFNNDLLYYRWIAEGFGILRKHYANKMSFENENKKKYYNFYAGYLVKEGFNYYIIPAKRTGKSRNGFHQEQDNVGKQFAIEPIKDAGKVIGYRIFSGKMQGKKHCWVIEPPDETTERIPVPEEVIESYKNDKSRNTKNESNVNPLFLANKGEIAPCFYTPGIDKYGRKIVKSFGHTGYYRIPYERTIGNFVDQDKLPKGEYDIDEAIFGREKGNDDGAESFAGRVYFESAKIVSSEGQDIFLGECIPKILSTPKPTAFQLYLEQNRGDDLKHYDSDDTRIRGYKLYWHRWDGDNPHFWEANELRLNKKLGIVFRKYGIDIRKFNFIEEDRNKINIKKRYSEITDTNLKRAIKEHLLSNSKLQYSVINPIKPGVKFRFRIRFENLTNEELGALLFVLDLPEEHYHKLGRGKPLGLGSVKISPKLYLIDRKERYSRLFDGNTWNFAEKEEEDLSKYKRSFEVYILSKIKEPVKSLWDVERMQQLKTLLDWKNIKLKDWINRTEYMDIEDDKLKKRCILPKPKEVVSEHR